MTAPPTAYDAWIFARLRFGHTLNGEVDRISDLYRILAKQMSKSEFAERDRIWREGLEILDECDAGRLVERVASVDPESAQPEEADEEEEWPPLRLARAPPVEPFPIDVFPDSVRQMAIEASRAVGCDVGLAAAPILAIVGGVIGRSANILLGSNWFASSSLFVANIALPGSGKSPALDYVMLPIKTIDQELAEEFAQIKKEFLEGDKKDRPPSPPAPRRIVLEDATMESVARRLAENSRGLVMIYDELSVLLGGLGQYKSGRGNDQANLLKVWAGAPITIDRVQNEFGEPIRVPHPAISIFGNLPPDKLVHLVEQGNDGMLDRWLFVFPDRRPKLKASQRRPVNNRTIELWTDVVRRLWLRQPEINDGRWCPQVVYFTNAGKAEFDRWDDMLVDECNSPDFLEDLGGYWSKLQAYAARLCLVLTLLRHAADLEARSASIPLAGPAEARDAWRLAAYFKSHFKRVRAYLQGKGLGGTPEGSRLILNWIRNHPHRVSFPQSDLTRAYPPTRGYDRAMLEDGLTWLAERNALQVVPTPQRPDGSPGRKASPLLAVHPDLTKVQEKQERQENGFDSPDVPVSPALPEE